MRSGVFRSMMRSGVFRCAMRSGQCWRDPPPQTSTQTVFDPALLPLLHGVCLVGRTKHRHTATPEHKTFKIFKGSCKTSCSAQNSYELLPSECHKKNQTADVCEVSSTRVQTLL